IEASCLILPETARRRARTIAASSVRRARRADQCENRGGAAAPPLSARGLRHGGARRLGLEVGDDLLAEEPQGVEHLLVARRPDRAQKDHLLDAQRLVHLDKADAFGRSPDAELLALLADLGGRRLARVGPRREALVARVIALVVGRHGGRVVVAPHQAGALALLLDVPANELAAALGGDFRVGM